MGGVIYFGLNCALASIGAFLPTIITTFGFSTFYSLRHSRFLITFFSAANALAQLLTVPPYFVSAIVMVTFSFYSDKLQSRGIFMTISSCIGGFGYL